MADILDEVIHDKRDEQKMLYFKKALPIVIAVTIVVVIGMIINDYRLSKATKHNKEIGDTIIQSMENLSTDPSLAIQGFDFVVHNAQNHAKDIAMLQQLAITIRAGDKTSSLNIAQDIITTKDYLPLTQAYAKLIWISLTIDSDDISEESKTKLVEYFDTYTQHTAFYGSAHLMEAIWYSKTDKEKSKTILQNLISSKMVTDTLKEEAKALLSNLTIEN